jgi:hypothetical protein
LVKALEAAGEDLLLKKVYWNNESKYQPFVFVGPVEDWKEDLETLIPLSNDERDPTGIIREFHFILSLGLIDNPEVDWVARTGGPAPKASVSSAAPTQSVHVELDRDVPIALADFISPSGPGGPEGE